MWRRFAAWTDRRHQRDSGRLEQRHQPGRRWFYNDEWDFIVTRQAGDFDDLVDPHNGHWSTLPIVYYRVLYHFTGLRSYLPYLGVVIASHLLVAVLLRMVMRRSGVRPWIATVVASLFVVAMIVPGVAWAAEVVARYRSAFGIVTVIVLLAFVLETSATLSTRKNRRSGCTRPTDAS